MKKINPHKCPRCGTEIFFLSEEHFKKAMSQPFLACPACCVHYKINLDKNNKIISVEKLMRQLEIRFTLSNDSWVAYEEPMPDETFESLVSTMKLLELAEQQTKLSGLTALQTLFGDPMSAMFWDQSFKQQSQNLVSQALLNLERIYNAYPFQVRKILNSKGLGKYLNPLSTICPKCKSTIPRSRINNCPFCKREEETKEEEDPLRILKLRYAKGEITKEEYEEMKKTLKS